MQWNRRGFTFLAVMFLIVLIGTGSSVAAKRWKTAGQREKETELLFRGEAIQRAIELYYRRQAGVGQYPKSLEELLQDPRSASTVRYLRKLYTDPMTGGEWALIQDEKERIKGVRSASQETPLKVANFPDTLKHFEGKETYAEWVFEFKPQASTSPPTPVKTGTTSPQSTTPKPPSSQEDAEDRDEEE
jgi:type II secretory pathway pseudopilin PulG